MSVRSPVSARALAALACVLWLSPGVASVGRAPEPASGVRPQAALPDIKGPWGELTLTPIVISPPLEYLPRDLAPPRAPRWFFPTEDRPGVDRILRAAGVASADVAALMATAQPYDNGAGVTLTPTVELVRRLSPESRRHLYPELGQSPLNQPQDFAFRYRGATVDDWFGGAPVSAETLRLVEPLVYRDGEFLFFADFDVIRPLVADPDELQRLHKRLLRQATLLVGLRVGPQDDLDRIVEYWGRGGRRTDIRPLLESIASSGGRSTIDISHLLPTLARQNLYRYPRTTPNDLARPILANCLWTALNFFNSEPDDRYLDENVAIATLKRDYYFIQDNFQLGDIVAVSDSKGAIFHAAVYLAGGLIFGKNGSSPLAPWTILPLQDLDGHYAEERARGWSITYLRRKDL